MAKLKNLMKVSKGTVMDIRGEESHSGSHAAYSRKWKGAGGGALSAEKGMRVEPGKI